MDLPACMALVPRINEHAAGLRGVDLKRAVAPGDVVAAFAVVVEACRRASGERLTADRLAAAVAVHFALPTDGDVVLAALADAVAGRTVHVVSSTDEAAGRDAERARPIGRVLGLDVGLVVPDLDTPGRQAAYRAGVTCGRANELGYDYLRDNLAWSRDELVQRGLDCAYVAEVDNDLANYLITAEVGGSKVTLARITAYGFFRRYRKVAGVGDPAGHPTDFEYEDVWDSQCRSFYERRQRILNADTFPEFEKLAGSAAYEERRRQIAEQSGFGLEVIPPLQRKILLACSDVLWSDQLAGMTRLRERTTAHDDPVAEFQRQADTQYKVMLEAIPQQAIDTFFDIDLTPR